MHQNKTPQWKSGSETLCAIGHPIPQPHPSLPPKDSRPLQEDQVWQKKPRRGKESIKNGIRFIRRWYPDARSPSKHPHRSVILPHSSTLKPLCLFSAEASRLQARVCIIVSCCPDSRGRISNLLCSQAFLKYRLSQIQSLRKPHWYCFEEPSFYSSSLLTVRICSLPALSGFSQC